MTRYGVVHDKARFLGGLSLCLIHTHVDRTPCAIDVSYTVVITINTIMKISISRESIYWLTIVALILVIGFSQFAYAWTAPSGSPPAGNVAGPLTVGSASQTKAGDLGAQRLCLPGSNPSGGCISTWTSGVTGSGTTGKIPQWTSASAIGDSKIYDRGYNSFFGTNQITVEYSSLESRGYGGSGGIIYADNYITAPIWCSLPGCSYYLAPQATSRMNTIVADNIQSGTFAYTSSDASLKKDVKTIPDALNKILKLRGVEFNWKKDNTQSVGLIAQEVEVVFPQLVGTNPTTGVKGVQYDGFIGPLIEAMKEQQKEIDELKKEIEELKR